MRRPMVYRSCVKVRSAALIGNSFQPPHFPGVVIVHRLRKLRARVHHKRSVTSHRLTDRLSTQDQKNAVPPSLDRNSFTLRAKQRELRFALQSVASVDGYFALQ